MKKKLETLAKENNYTKQIIECVFENELNQDEFIRALTDANIPETWSDLICLRAGDIKNHVDIDNEKDFDDFAGKHILITSEEDEDEDNTKLNISNDNLTVVKYTYATGMNSATQENNSQYDTVIYIFETIKR